MLAINKIIIPNGIINCGLPNSCIFFFVRLMSRFTSGGSCWMTNKELAKLFSVSIPTIQKWLKWLKDNGLIKCKYDKKSRRKIVILKRFSFDKKDKGTYYVSIPDFINGSFQLSPFIPATTIYATTKLVLAFILSLSKNDAARCSAGNKRLATLLGMSERTIRRHVAKLRFHNICQTIVEKIRACVGGEYKWIYERSIYPLIVKKSALAHMEATSLARPSKFSPTKKTAIPRSYNPVNPVNPVRRAPNASYYEKNGVNNIGNIIGKLNL